LVTAGVFCQSFSGFFGVATVNIFSSVNRNDANVTGCIFFQPLFWLSLARWFASLGSGSLQFLSTTVLQGSAAARLRCGGIFNYCFIRNLLLSLSVKEFSKSVTIWQR